MKEAAWSPDAKLRVRALWNKGATASEIAEQLGRTRNAVLGLVHRMGLPARPSPIRTAGTAPAETPVRRQPRAARAPHRASETAGSPPAPPPSPPPTSPPPPADPEPLPLSASAPRERSRAISPISADEAEDLRRNGCRCPLGGTRRAGFQFCGEAKVPGCVYCEAHRARAYVKPSETKSEVDVPMFASFAPRPVIRRVGAEA